MQLTRKMGVIIIGRDLKCSCIQYFRFRKEHIFDLVQLLWPKMSLILFGEYDKIKVHNRYTVHFETGILIMLFKFARPVRVTVEMERRFFMKRSHISAITKTFSYALFRYSWPYLNNPIIWHSRMPYYASLVKEKADVEFDNIWGFIDGTLRKTSRPTKFQRSCYSGHKRCHGL